MRKHIAIIAQNIDRARVVSYQWRHVEGPDREPLLDTRREYERRINDIVARGVADGSFARHIDQRIAVLTILGNLNWSAELHPSTGPDPIDVISDGCRRYSSAVP